MSSLFSFEMRFTILFALLGITTLLCTNCTRLKVGTQAPSFTAEMVGKGRVDLADLKGKKILLSFMRNVGCPICNLHTHELRKYADSLEALGVVVLMIHQSPTSTIAQYLQQDARTWSFSFVSDEKRALYKLYRVKPSLPRFILSAFHGALKKRKEGAKLYKSKIPQEGKRGMLGADFLLDEAGKIIKLSYAQYVGDHLAPAEIYRIFKNVEK